MVLSWSCIVVLVIAILTYNKVTFTLKPFCIPTNINLPVSFFHDDMIHQFVANLCLKKVEITKLLLLILINTYYSQCYQHCCILTVVLPLVLQLDDACVSGIALDNFCVSIMSVTYNHLIMTNWIQNNENWPSPVFFYQH